MPEAIESNEKQLFAATFVRHPRVTNPIWGIYSGTKLVDTMEVPTEYHEIVNLCRFFYEHDGIAYTTVNKQVELGINGYGVNPGTCTENEYKVYKSLNDDIETFLREAAVEFLISGLVIPEITWDSVKGTTIDSKLRKHYQLPTDIWFRDPQSIDLKKTPLPNLVSTYVRISDEDKNFIESKGVYPDGTEDREVYELLVKKYPEYVAAVKAGKLVFKLEEPQVIRRYARSGKVWPTPYLLPALELFLHKRNLRKMDYAIASRVISAIQLFRLGNDDFPLTEDDDDVIDDLKSEMSWRGLSGNLERVFQLFSNHTLQIDWVMPDTAALLDEGKYRSINQDILIALGLPRIVVAGETSRSGSSNAEIAMLPPISTIEAMRTSLMQFPRKLYQEIKERNNFKNVPEPYYPPVKLQSAKDLIDMGKEYYASGVISRTGWAEVGGFDFETEMVRMKVEQDKMKEMGLPEFAPQPFSPQPNQGAEKPKIEPSEAKK